MKTIFTAIVLWGLSAPAQTPWGLNDLSILLPLPTAREEVLLLRPGTPTPLGQLLPESITQALPPLIGGEDRARLYASLRVIGIRFDPCFHEGHGPIRCQPQIRLIWQPLAPSVSGFTTRDAAVHTFFNFSPVEWQEITSELSRLKAKSAVSPTLPLQPHPTLVRQGYAGPYWAELSRLIIQRCGLPRLSRVTIMNANPTSTAWVFMGFDHFNGQLLRIRIPRILRGAQGFLANTDRPLEFRAQISPAPEGVPDFLSLLNDSDSWVKTARPENLAKAVQDAVILENPVRENAGTADCVSCHAARAVNPWARQKIPLAPWDRWLSTVTYRAAAPMANVTPNPRRTNVLRAFGYFDRDPIVSQRVINETAEVLRQMTLSNLRRHR